MHNVSVADTSFLGTASLSISSRDSNTSIISRTCSGKSIDESSSLSSRVAFCFASSPKEVELNLSTLASSIAVSVSLRERFLLPKEASFRPAGP